MKTKQVYNKLKNNLEYLIISNSYINKSSFSLDVKVGTFDEDKESVGFAHLVEHLIFNSKKQNQFLNLINKAQGSFNASTGSEFTNFKFDCDSSYFIRILDIFLDFILKPDFTLKKINYELEIINSEFNKEAYLEEYFFLLKLKNKLNTRIDKISVKALKSFFNKFYKANNIKIAVQSNLDVKLLIDFLDTKLNNFKKGYFNKNVFNFKNLENKIQINTDKNILKLYFYIPDIHKTIDSKVHWLIKDLISLKHNGSLFSYLKNYIHEISSTVDIYFKYGIFCVEFYLKEDGFKNYNKIIAIFFSYINFLKTHSLPVYYYEEQKIIAKMQLNSMLNQEGKGFINFYSRNMFYYKPNIINKKALLINKYSNNSFIIFLDFINKNNSSILLFSLFNKAVNKSTEDNYYKLKYRALDINIKEKKINFKYPVKNKFIPKELISFKKDNIKYPHKILDDKKGFIWFLNDYNLSTYEAYINFDIITPVVNLSNKNKLLSIYYNFLVLENIEKYKEKFNLANINFGIERIDRGYSVFVVGFSNNILNALNLIIDAFLLKDKFINKKFNELKTNLNNIYYSFNNLAAYEFVKYELYNLLHSYNIHRDNYKNKCIKINDVKVFINKVFEEINLEFYVFGNIKDSNIIRAYNNIFKSFKAKPLLNKIDLNDIRVPKKNEIININKSDNKTSLASFYYFGKRSTKLSAIIQIGFVFFKAFMFKELRTKYGVYTIESKLDFYVKDLGISLIVEFNKIRKQKLIKIIDSVLINFIKSLSKLNKKELRETKTAFNKKVLKNNLNLNDWMNELVLTAVLNGNTNYAHELVDEVLKLSIDEIVFCYKSSLDKKYRKSYTVIVG